MRLATMEGSGSTGDNRLLPRRHWPWLGTALLVVMATWSPSLSFDFVSWDDPLYVTENPLVVGPPSQVRVGERLLTTKLGYPMPITVASYWLEHALFGLSPWAFHLTNLLLHVCSCLLVFVVGRRLGLGLAGALAALLCFGLHRVVAEPVCWVTGRKDLLAACFTLWATDEALRHPFSPRVLRSWVAPLLFLFAALSKPVALFLPAALFSWHVLVQRKPAAWALRSMLPYLAVCVALFPVALVSHQAIGGVRTDLAWLQLLRQGWYALGFHLGLLSFSITPSAKYLPSPWPPPFTPAVDLLPAIWAILLLLLIRRLPAEQRRVPLACVCWAGLAYLPSSSLIPLTRLLADSYVYLPLAGLAWLLGFPIDGLLQRLREASRPLAAMLTLITVACLVLSSLAAGSSWASSYTLWAQVHEHYPRDYRACRNVGNALNERQQPTLALAQYQRCAARYGARAFEKNIALTLLMLGRNAEARELLERVARRRPDDQVVREYLRRLR